jgi:hypothetical protein
LPQEVVPPPFEKHYHDNNRAASFPAAATLAVTGSGSELRKLSSRDNTKVSSASLEQCTLFRKKITQAILFRKKKVPTVVSNAKVRRSRPTPAPAILRNKSKTIGVGERESSGRGCGRKASRGSSHRGDESKSTTRTSNGGRLIF